METNQFNQMIQCFNQQTDISIERGLQLLKTKEIPIFTHNGVLFDLLRNKHWSLKSILLIYKTLIRDYKYHMELADIQTIIELYSFAPRLCPL